MELGGVRGRGQLWQWLFGVEFADCWLQKYWLTYVPVQIIHLHCTKPQTWQLSVIFSDPLLVFSIPLSCMRSRKQSRRQLGKEVNSHPVGTRADLDCIHQLIRTFGQCMTVWSKSGNPFYNACQATSVLGAWTGQSPMMSCGMVTGYVYCVLFY